jgi:hypothetical protein
VGGGAKCLEMRFLLRLELLSFKLTKESFAGLRTAFVEVIVES